MTFQIFNLDSASSDCGDSSYFAIEFNISSPNLSTICLPKLSTITLAPFGTDIPKLLLILFNSFINVNLLIIEEHATDKHLSSALVVKVIFLKILQNLLVSFLVCMRF